MPNNWQARAIITDGARLRVVAKLDGKFGKLARQIQLLEYSKTSPALSSAPGAEDRAGLVF